MISRRRKLAIACLAVGVLATVTLLALAAVSFLRQVSCQTHVMTMGIVFKPFALESEGELWPQLSGEAGRLMCLNNSEWNEKPLWPEYMSLGKILFCPSDPDSAWDRDSGPEVCLDDHSYLYLGYVVKNDVEMQAFADAYRERVRLGLPFNSDLEVPDGTGTGGGNRIYRLREGVERITMPDDMHPAAVGREQAQIPVLIERSDHHFHRGGNVLFMDGHAEFVRYPNWPMTDTTIEIFESLDILE